MATMHITADDAFGLLIKLPQAENRKLVEIATKIAHRVSRRPAG